MNKDIKYLIESIYNFNPSEYSDEDVLTPSEINSIIYKYFPKNTLELRKIIFDRINENPEEPYLLDIDTSNIISMQELFTRRSEIKKLNLSTWNTSNVTNMGAMFNGCENLESLNISSFNTSNVLYMNGMFNACYSLTTLDLSNFDTSNVVNMIQMFSQCKSLEKLDLSNFITEKVKNMSLIFFLCESLKHLNIYQFTSTNLTDINWGFSSCPVLTYINAPNFDISKVNEKIGIFEESNLYIKKYFNRISKELKESKLNNFNPADYEDDSDIILDQPTVETILYKHCPNTFDELKNIVKRYVIEGKTNFNDIDVSNIEDFSYLFSGLEIIRDIDLSEWDVSNGKTFAGMFSGCVNFNSDLSNWDVSNGIDFENMFKLCKKFKSDLSGWNFKSAKNLLGINWSLYNVNVNADMIDKFYIDTHKGTPYHSYFPKTKDELSSILYKLIIHNYKNLNIIDTSKITDMSYLFNIKLYSKNIDINISDWDVSNVKTFRYFFNNSVPSDFNSDLSKWDVSNCYDFGYMFIGCESFVGKGLREWNVSNGKFFDNMFSGCYFFDEDISSWNVSNGERFSNMFYRCFDFNCNLSKWDVSKGTEFEYMFQNCTSFKGNGLSSWNVSNSISFRYMFDQCHKFNEDLKNWDTSKCKIFTYMFNGCIQFNSDLSKWDVSNGYDFRGMFRNCHELTSDFSEWNITKHENIGDTMCDEMFYGCIKVVTPEWYDTLRRFIR